MAAGPWRRERRLARRQDEVTRARTTADATSGAAHHWTAPARTGRNSRPSAARGAHAPGECRRGSRRHPPLTRRGSDEGGNPAIPPTIVHASRGSGQWGSSSNHLPRSERASRHARKGPSLVGRRSTSGAGESARFCPRLAPAPLAALPSRQLTAPAPAWQEIRREQGGLLSKRGNVITWYISGIFTGTFLGI